MKHALNGDTAIIIDSLIQKNPTEMAELLKSIKSKVLEHADLRQEVVGNVLQEITLLDDLQEFYISIVISRLEMGNALSSDNLVVNS